jgi:hypothetical protein
METMTMTIVSRVVIEWNETTKQQKRMNKKREKNGNCFDVSVKFLRGDE